MNAIKAFFGWLFTPLVGFSLLGFIATALVIWFAAPAMGFEEAGERFLIICVLVAVFLLVWLVRWLIARYRGKSIEEELENQGDDDGQREAEIEAIREKMHEAIAALKTSTLGATHRGSAALYALPWYMIIGPSAAGKSTLLQQSGLNFPITNTEQLHVQGYGGTRNCDWWLSDEAILLDTAGRYTTEETDHEEWLEFLALLRKHRKAMPINGVMVAISISELLTSDSDSLEHHVKILRARIDELMRHLGLIFPVFIVFTKCDLIHGFEAFFEDLTEAEREQLWGAYLLEEPVDDDEPGAAFERRMHQLYTRLCEMRLQKMALQRNIERKSVVFDFPNQFLSATDKLLEFVNLLFRANRYQETPRFAGVYFTSGTQEGTPVQRLVGNLREAFGYAEQAVVERNDESKPYFIKKLFDEVILPLKDQARVNQRRLIRGRVLKSMTLVASLLAIVWTSAILVSAFSANQQELVDGNRAAEVLALTEQDDAASSFERYRAIEGVFVHHQALEATLFDHPVLVALGIRSAPRQMEQLGQLLENRLEVHFRNPVISALEAQLTSYARQWRIGNAQQREALRDEYYSALAIYLMIVRVPEYLEPVRAAPLLSEIWVRQLGLASGGQGFKDVSARVPHLAEMVQFYLPRHQAERWTAQDSLISIAQEQLRTLPNAEYLYAQIVGKGKVQLPTLQVDDLLTGRNRGQLISRAILPALYTERNWREFMQEEMDTVIVRAIRGDWVLGAEGPEDEDALILEKQVAKDLRIAIRELYFRDYADAWFDFIGTIAPKRIASLNEARGQFASLARREGPLAELMRVIAQNIDVSDASSSRKIKIPKKLKLPGFLGKLFKKATKKKKGEVDAPVGKGLPELELWLGDLRRFTDSKEPEGVSQLVDGYQLLLSAMVGDLDRISLAADRSRESLAYAGRILGDGASDTALHQGWTGTSSLFSAIEPRTRVAFEKLFHSPIRDTWAQILQQSRLQLERDWQNEVVDRYRERIHGRFPFAVSGPDARLSDVSEFFRPENGILWSFVGTNMSPFMQEERQGWQERRWLDMGLTLSDFFFTSLRQAKVITQSLFGPGASAPSMEFQVYPLPARGLSEMSLEVDGQAYRYRNEPQEWRRFTWPGKVESNFSRVTARSTHSHTRAELRATGQWGLLHLLRDARLTNEGNGNYLVEWALKSAGSPVTVGFRVRADRERNLFDQRINGFQLPGTPVADAIQTSE